MQHLFLLASSFFFFSLLVACGGDTAENAFPKKVPVDERAQKERQEILSKTDFVYKDWEDGRQNIETLLEQHSGYYQTKDGGDLALEYTTYYLDEEKTTPIKTNLTYIGSFDLVYWFPDGRIWLERDGYDFLIDEGKIVKTMRAGEVSEATSVEQEQALKLIAKAREAIFPDHNTL